MEEGCITAKAADIPIKKCVLPSMLRFGPYLMFYLQFFPIIYNFRDIFDCILSMPENQMTFLLKMVLRIWQPFEGLCRARGRGRCQNGNDLCGSGDYWMLQLAASVCSLDIWAKIPFSSISVSGCLLYTSQAACKIWSVI